MKTPWRVCLTRGCTRRNQNVQPFLRSERKQKGNEKQREHKNIHTRKKAAQCAAKQPTTTTTSGTKERPTRNLAIQTFRAFQNSRTWCRRRKVHVNLRNLYKMDMVLALAAAEDFYSTKKLCTLHHVSLILSTREFCSYKKHLSKMWSFLLLSSCCFMFLFLLLQLSSVFLLHHLLLHCGGHVFAKKRKKQDFFFLFFFFFFQSCYKGNSLHDCKLKNTQECTAQMLTSKPMYKESKCMWGCITWCRSCTAIKPCVCVCVYVYVLPRPKAGSKTSFGAARSFLLPTLWNSEFHNL